eukprot:Gb_26027 [translate_table: standard]
MSNCPTSTRLKALVLSTSNNCPPTGSKIQQGLNIDGQAFLNFGSSFLPLSLRSPNSSLKASSSFPFAHLTSPFEVGLPPENFNLECRKVYARKCKYMHRHACQMECPKQWAHAELRVETLEGLNMHMQASCMNGKVHTCLTRQKTESH